MNQIEKAWELENHDGISIYSDISSFDGSRTQDMMEDFDEEYTPENPTINEPTLRSITMVPGVKPIVLTKEPVREFPGLQRVVTLSMLLALCRPLVLGIFLITPRTQYLQKLVSGCAMGL
jgi:uncharacterized protein YneF (UPF0154 family)